MEKISLCVLYMMSRGFPARSVEGRFLSKETQSYFNYKFYVIRHSLGNEKLNGKLCSTLFRLVLNQPEKSNYNPDLVWFKINALYENISLCVYGLRGDLILVISFRLKTRDLTVLTIFRFILINLISAWLSNNKKILSEVRLRIIRNKKYN